VSFLKRPCVTNLLFAYPPWEEELFFQSKVTNQSSAKKRPEPDQKVAARDARQIKERIRNRRAQEDAPEAHPLDHLEHQQLRAIAKAQRPASPLLRPQQLLKLLELLLLVVVLALRQSCRSRHEVGRQFANRRARAPQKRLNSDFGHDRQN